MFEKLPTIPGGKLYIMVFEACVMIIKNVLYHKKIVSYFSLEYINRFKNTTLSPFFFKIESLARLENDIRNVNQRKEEEKEDKEVVNLTYKNPLKS